MQGSAIRVGKQTVSVSNLDKVLYPGGRFTKSDVIAYYSRVARVLLPHFRNRPVTLVRFPNGVFGESFYEKDAPGFTPWWVRTFPVPRTEGGTIRYILINDRPTLVWAANLAALELHPFLHRAPQIDRPTHVVFDLDPGEGVDILACAEVALLVRDLLAKLKLRCFPKVSGGKGLQLYVPLNTPANYHDTQSLAHAVADLLAREHSDRVVAEMSKAVRVGKVFIDWSQNAPAKTTVGVYSLRAKKEWPTVSAPVTWDELQRACHARKPERLLFSPDAVLDRIQKHGDLFARVLTLRQKLPSSFITSAAGSKPPKALQRYAEKRDFNRTAEPAPSLPRRSAQGSRRRFVVQKHAAQHLHFDFRLEMHEVLKSWAVPKGVPLKNGEKHSAFGTEDHPLAYLDFEGIIPAGQYGGGTVMVWDIGTYDVMNGNYYQGELTVFLTGRKLKGQWTLKKLKSENENKPLWLLMKTGGDAKPIPAQQIDRSAVTRRTMDQIAEQKTAVWESNRQPVSAVASVSRSASASARAPQRRKPKKAAKPPQFVPPMKATLVAQLPQGPEWIYEIKWDGYRALAAKHGDAVQLLSLKNRNLAADFPSVVAAVRGIGADTALLDGEVVAVDDKGCPSFQALQNRASLGAMWQIVYYAFDLLNLEGEDLRHIPLGERKARLKSVLEGSRVRFNAELPGSASQVLQAIKQAGLEGVVAKRTDSIYAARTRSLAWQKLKFDQAQEFVIGGYNPAGALFSSLLAGYYDNGRLLFAGKVRQGFNPALRETLMKHLKRLKVKRCPFANLPSSRTGHFGEGVTAEDMAKLHWVRPKLVAQVSFREWTSYGLLRHATFESLREDKEAQEVVKENPMPQS